MQRSWYWKQGVILEYFQWPSRREEQWKAGFSLSGARNRRGVTVVLDCNITDRVMSVQWTWTSMGCDLFLPYDFGWDNDCGRNACLCTLQRKRCSTGSQGNVVLMLQGSEGPLVSVFRPRLGTTQQAPKNCRRGSISVSNGLLCLCHYCRSWNVLYNTPWSHSVCRFRLTTHCTLGELRISRKFW